MTIARISGEVKIVHYYICKKCKIRKEGTSFTYRTNIDHSLESLVKTIEETRISPFNQPIGWASYCGYGGVDYKCEKCKG